LQKQKISVMFGTDHSPQGCVFSYQYL